MKDKMNKYQILAGIILFGSVWGLLECTLGGVKLGGALENFPMGALLGGLVGLGLMVSRSMLRLSSRYRKLNASIPPATVRNAACLIW